VDVSGGLCDDPHVAGRLRHFRSSAMGGSGGESWRCLVAARVTAELVAMGGRSGVPALPCRRIRAVHRVVCRECRIRCACHVLVSHYLTRTR
jgi:hypothetical protein